MVDPFVADYLRNGIEGASEADAVLLTIDTPGGLDSSMREIIKAIQDSKVPVLCYVVARGREGRVGGRVHPRLVPRGRDGARDQRRRVHPRRDRRSDALDEDRGGRRRLHPRRSREQRGRNAELASRFVTESKSITAQEALDGNIIDLIATRIESCSRRSTA